MENTVVWFDLPVVDLPRAKAFYSEVFAVELQDMENGPTKMAMFPFEPGAASGALILSEGMKPSEDGVTIYLNGGADCAVPLGRVEKAGGKVLQEKMPIGEYGFIGYFLDTEGNKLGIHSPK